MKYKIVITQLEDYTFTHQYGEDKDGTETRTREIEVFSQRTDQLNLLEVIMAVNSRTVYPTTQEILANLGSGADL